MRLAVAGCGRRHGKTFGSLKVIQHRFEHNYLFKETSEQRHSSQRHNKLPSHKGADRTDSSLKTLFTVSNSSRPCSVRFYEPSSFDGLSSREGPIHYKSTIMRGQMRKRVCLFGTSADPPTGHGGHFGIVTHLASMESLDEVRVLPVYRHMFQVRQ